MPAIDSLSRPDGPFGYRDRLRARIEFLLCLVVFTLGFTHVNDAAGSEPKHVLMIAGNPSHGYGSHEHYAGLKILAETLEQSDLSMKATVVRGWPEDEAIFNNADSVVLFSDGGARHFALPHRDRLKQVLSTGVGFVCLHYATEVPKGSEGDDWLSMLGGNFETDWSVNPHWVAKFDSLPTHPVTRGVKPFSTNDEWYFHLRFAAPPAKITPILQAVAPEDTMRRPDGAHSGNPHVRKSVAAGELQTVAWTFDRSDGGRSFGFTGGHYHWNWGNESVLRLVSNAIAWTAGAEVPVDGIRLQAPGIQKLLTNQDYEPPKDFDPNRVAREFNIEGSPDLKPTKPAVELKNEEGKGKKKKAKGKQAQARLLDVTPLVTTETNQVSSDHDPKQAVAGLEIAEGLEVTLAASEPELRSLTNLDIDDRGRVWVCDVMNYRKNQGSRPEGDRILILEDTNGDGVMDKSKVYYQGNDIDSAMGICILGNDVIVSAAPYIWRFTDEDGDDIPDKKVAMFTETGQPQHDHSNHSFLFGPDGKLYWNFGNTGQQVKDGDGKVVVDIHGREVIDNGKPFFGGMPFRCNLDGSEFEVLAHNFRNNWETTVDSFGTIWQSDNDDDGNRGTRINFVMEHGNYGYRDEMTGATWKTDRINMEKEIPLKHWHLNDPGVVPNVLQTGAGSPSGICLYEGKLLPERFHNQMIHCDPGPNMVRAYPVTADGAGYSATIEPMVTGLQDKWFRPADVCTAPDGSLFVTDWYDPGVGGHRQEDIDRGRLFRIAPPGVAYKVPKFDYTTVDGAIQALQNPAVSVRYKAWMALHSMGQAAESGLQKLYASKDARMRARALWLLGKIEGRGEYYVRQALQDNDADIRITGIRLMRQLKLMPSEFLSSVVDDPSPAVRREALVALRYDAGPAMPELWAKLASHYDGDRWYLEALGLASDIRAKDCYAAFSKSGAAALDNPETRDILWRLRAPEAADALTTMIADESVGLEQTDRYFRALEFHPADVRTKSLVNSIVNSKFASSDKKDLQAKNDAVIVRAIERLEASWSTTDTNIQDAVNRYIATRKGTPEFLKLVKRFKPVGMESSLVELALQSGDDSSSVEAVRLLSLGADGANKVWSAMESSAVDGTKRMVQLLGLLGTERAIKLLTDVVANHEQAYDVRADAIRGLAKSNLGASSILALASAGTLPGDTKLLAGGLLAKSDDDKIKSQADKLLPLPAQADAKPMPPVDELARLVGDVANGETLFRTKATCSNCHIVNGFGKQVGPDLSEIGTKLPREALYTSILAPSAGISHNYENFVVLLESGQVVSGLKISETDSQLTIRTAEAIDRTFDQEDVADVKQSEKSIMPENLHHTIDQQGLVDIVEYMTTLKKK